MCTCEKLLFFFFSPSLSSSVQSGEADLSVIIIFTKCDLQDYNIQLLVSCLTLTMKNIDRFADPEVLSEKRKYFKVYLM